MLAFTLLGDLAPVGVKTTTTTPTAELSPTMFSKLLAVKTASDRRQASAEPAPSVRTEEQRTYTPPPSTPLEPASQPAAQTPTSSSTPPAWQPGPEAPPPSSAPASEMPAAGARPEPVETPAEDQGALPMTISLTRNGKIAVGVGFLALLLGGIAVARRRRR